MKKVLFVFLFLNILVFTLTAKTFKVIFVNGDVKFLVNGKLQVAKKDMRISDNWILLMGDHSTLAVLGEKKHEIGYTNNVNGKKLKDVIGNPQEFHFWDYPKHLFKPLVKAIFHSDPEIKDKKVIKFNGNSVRGDNDEVEYLNEYQVEYIKIIEKALEGE